MTLPIEPRPEVRLRKPAGTVRAVSDPPSRSGGAPHSRMPADRVVAVPLSATGPAERLMRVAGSGPALAEDLS
ncbi:hypothetical protein GCM10010532_031320 [Dactylosporangium siamense]|uniref:Uncharacterized protein n=1 Tax=Dactylosporangium siamense TaxID=685454 RepID=A0A919U6W5_9ACTN|nr:hypothetical protein Dsi01nite_019580 [Dactylosporangium siamense]